MPASAEAIGERPCGLFFCLGVSTGAVCRGWLPRLVFDQHLGAQQSPSSRQTWRPLQADKAIGKSQRSAPFDIGKSLSSQTITANLASSISSGNWTIKRFRMDRKGATQVGYPVQALSSSKAGCSRSPEAIYCWQ